MYSRWTQHLHTEEEKESFRKEIYSARRVLERLRDMVREDREYLGRSEMDQRVYDLPNWDYRQAHRNGYLQYMNAIEVLVDLDQQNKSVMTHTERK